MIKVSFWQSVMALIITVLLSLTSTISISSSSFEFEGASRRRMQRPEKFNQENMLQGYWIFTYFMITMWKISFFVIFFLVHCILYGIIGSPFIWCNYIVYMILGRPLIWTDFSEWWILLLNVPNVFTIQWEDPLYSIELVLTISTTLLPLAIVDYSSEIRGLRSTKCSREMLKSLFITYL